MYFPPELKMPLFYEDAYFENENKGGTRPFSAHETSLSAHTNDLICNILQSEEAKNPFANDNDTPKPFP